MVKTRVTLGSGEPKTYTGITLPSKVLAQTLNNGDPIIKIDQTIIFLEDLSAGNAENFRNTTFILMPSGSEALLVQE